jgi:hypothetical protein
LHTHPKNFQGFSKLLEPFGRNISPAFFMQTCYLLAMKNLRIERTIGRLETKTLRLDTRNEPSDG